MVMVRLTPEVATIGLVNEILIQGELYKPNKTGGEHHG